MAVFPFGSKNWIDNLRGFCYDKSQLCEVESQKFGKQPAFGGFFLFKKGGGELFWFWGFVIFQSTLTIRKW